MPAIFIDLPCKPYVKRYLINHYGEPCKLTREPNTMLYLALEKQSNRRHSEARQVYAETVRLMLVDDLYLRSGFLLSTTTIMQINRSLEYQLKKEMRAYLDGRLDGNKDDEIRLAILDYARRKGFNEQDFPYDTMQKDYYRYRKKVRADLIRTKSGAQKNVGRDVRHDECSHA